MSRRTISRGRFLDTRQNPEEFPFLVYAVLEEGSIPRGIDFRESPAVDDREVRSGRGTSRDQGKKGSDERKKGEARKIRAGATRESATR